MFSLFEVMFYVLCTDISTLCTDISTLCHKFYVDVYFLCYLEDCQICCLLNALNNAVLEFNISST